MSGRFEPFIITGAVVVVAASTAVSLWSGAGLAWHYAALAGIVLAAFMIPLALRGKGSGIGARSRTLEAKLDKLGRRVHALEQKLVDVDDKMVHYSRSTVRAVASELDAVGAVMRDLAEAVAVHDAELFAPKPALNAADRAAAGECACAKGRGRTPRPWDFGLDAETVSAASCRRA